MKRPRRAAPRSTCGALPAGVLILVMIGTGCSLIPRFGRHAAIEPDIEKDASAAHTAADTSAASEDSAARSPARGDAAVSVDLSDAERLRLATEAERDIKEAERLIGAIRRDRLGADGLERLRTVEGLIGQARAASRGTDVEGAARVAHKARLLATELASTKPR